MNPSIKITEIRNGINYCLENASELIDDAELLFKNAKYARSYSIAQLAIEEVGKSLMLFNLYNSLQAGDRKKFDFKQFRANFRDHKHKTFESKVIDIMMQSKEKSEDFEKLALKAFDEIQLVKNGYYDNLKNNGFYVSIENNKFQKPNQVFDKDETLVFLNNSKKKFEFVKEWITKWLILDEKLGIDKEGIMNLLKK